MNRITKDIALIVLGCMLCLSMGCQKDNVVEETNNTVENKNYRFSKTIGFQQNQNNTWYEMVDAPMIIEKGEQTITIEQVIRMDGELSCFISFDNLVIENIEENLDFKEVIKVYSEEEDKWLESRGRGFSYDKEKDLLLRVEETFRCKKRTEEVALNILGEEYVVHLTPIQSYNSLDEIGFAQTHNGRSIIIDRTEDAIMAYTYSEDIWEISGLGEWKELEWNTEVRANEHAVFTYRGEEINGTKGLNIPEVSLKAECKDIQVTVPIPEESKQVDIPFSVGEDSYRVTEIQVMKEVTEDTSDLEAYYLNDNIILYMNIEPIVVEDNTEVTYIWASLYRTEEDIIEQSKNDQGEIETEVIGTYKVHVASSINGYYVDEELEITEPVLTFYIDKNTSLPQELILDIESVSKKWYQPYHFEFES